MITEPYSSSVPWIAAHDPKYKKPYTAEDRARDIAILNTPIEWAKPTVIPSTLFQGMPTDELAAVDAYEVQDEVGVVNNFRRKAIDGIESLKNSIVDFDLNEFIIREDISQLLLTGDVEQIKRDGLGILAKNAERMIADIAPGLLDGITDGIKSVADKVLESDAVTWIKDGSEGILSSVKNSDLVKGMSTLLDEVKDSKFVTGAVDLVSQSVILGELGSLAVDLGIPEFAEAWVDKAHDSVKDVVWSKVGSSALFKSDLITLNKALDNGGGMFLERYVSNPANTLLSNFKYQVSDTLDDSLSTSFGSLKSTLDKLDPKWDKTVVDGQERMKLDNFFDISFDAKLVLSTDDIYRPIVNTASAIGKKFHKEVLSDMISTGTGRDREIKQSILQMDSSISTESTMA